MGSQNVLGSGYANNISDLRTQLANLHIHELIGFTFTGQRGSENKSEEYIFLTYNFSST
jgi:hypothetical protein